jgi:hypothetical protein
MKRHNIDRFSKDDIFGGRLIAPMKQWLQSHNIETKNYDYNTDMGIITHYLQNKDYPEGQLYREEAFPLMEKYYRASHTDLNDDDIVDPNLAEGLFAVLMFLFIFAIRFI